MIPPIRDVSHARLLSQMLHVRARAAISFFALLLLVVSNLSAAASTLHSQDSSAKPTPAPAAQPPAATPAKPSAPAANDATPLQRAVHQKKVLTEEDLAKPVKPLSPGDLDGEENNSLCDLSCEADLRSQMGFGPDREGEFRNQMTLARHEISNDRAWNSTLQSALDAAGKYCDIQRQKAQILSKGDASPWMREQVNSRFAEREHKFVLDYRNSVGLLTQHIQTVQRFAAFQAAVMQYQVSEAAARACQDFNLP